jgi:hypothetical protein
VYRVSLGTEFLLVHHPNPVVPGWRIPRAFYPRAAQSDGLPQYSSHAAVKGAQPWLDQLVDSAEGLNSGRIQDLIGVNIADARDEVGIHEERLDSSCSALEQSLEI